MPRPRALAVGRAAAPPAIALALAGLLLAIRACAVAPPDAGLAPGAAQPGDPPGATEVREGSIYLPRSGPYVMGAQTRGPARITVRGHSIDARGAGRCKPWPAAPPVECFGVARQRMVLEAGPAAIRIAAPPGARLVWSPPGRRGSPEYVPASSLDPRPPDQASFDPDRAGTAVADGVIALLFGAVILGLVAWYLRGRWRRAPRALVVATLAVFAAAAAIRLYDLGGAGQTWDEDVNWTAGRNYVANVLAADADPWSWVWNYEHPPVMKYIAGTGAQLADHYGPARALSALMSAAACALVVLIGARLYRLRVGVLAGAIAALTPHLIAHGKVVGHESPSVLWWMLGIWLAVTAHDPPAAGAPSARMSDRTRLAARFAGLGVVLGVAVASRFVNVLLAPALGAILVVGAPAGLRRRTIAFGFAILPVVAVVTVVALWPRLWTDPVQHLQEAWERLNRQHALEPYMGGFTNQPPPFYFILYLLGTAPLGVLVGLAAGFARFVARNRAGPDERRAALVLLAALAAPILVSASPVRQDGVRYILPCLAVVAILAAAGLDWLADVLARRVPRLASRAFPIVAGATVLYLALVCMRIHPYYLDYYGEQVGGPAGVSAARRYETAWWGEGLDRAVAYVNAHAAPGARVHRECVGPKHLTWFRGDLWNPMVTDPRQADWVVVYQPATGHCAIPPGMTRVYTVDADGAPLVIVYKKP